MTAEVAGAGGVAGKLRVLLVEDSEDDEALLVRALRRAGVDVILERVETAEQMLAALEDKTWDVVLSDYNLPEFSAPQAFALLKSTGIDLPFIIVSGTVGEETAVEAMKLGAHDFILKGSLARLVPAIEREVRDAGARRVRQLTEERLVGERTRAEEALRRSEDQLRQLQKMEAVGRLAGGIAHDFNNLLSVVLTYAELLQENFEPGQSAHDDLGEIRKAAKRAADLTRQLLIFSRQQVIEPRVLDLNEVLANVDNMLRRTIGEDVELSVVKAPELGHVRADPGNVEQVIMNLVVNARDAMPTGGNVTIETANVVLDSAYAAHHVGVKPGPHVMLAVSDTGLGMAPATRARIFEPFFTTKEVGKGTGLGLSTVLGIVVQNAGSVWVYSEPGKGSTFKVYFPRVDAELEGAHAAPPPATLRGTEAILLVEDDDQVRAVARGILQRNGYTVLEARGSREALELSEGHRGVIHLLVSDVVMPKTSGPALARRLTARRPAMKVLFMSGYTDDAVIRHGVLRSGVAFLQKPITPETLTTKVREVLDADRGGPG